MGEKVLKYIARYFNYLKKSLWLETDYHSAWLAELTKQYQSHGSL